jgi:hemerythrin-like domain-containing protein
MMNYTTLMPIQIAAKVADFSKPMVLLSDCQRRMEMFLGVLHGIAQLENPLLIKDEQSSLEKALRYFHEAAPKHTADEEQSLFPRLRHSSRTEVQSAFRELERLESDHQRATPMHAEVELLGQRCLADGHLTSEQLCRFRELVARLTSMYRAHIDFEDSVLFPLATRVTLAGGVGKEQGKRRATREVCL